MYTYVFSCGVVFQSMTKIKDSKRVTAVSQKNLDAASASASVPSYLLLPVLSRTHACLLPLQWVGLLLWKGLNFLSPNLVQAVQDHSK